MQLYTALSIIFLLAFGLYQNEVATPVFTIMIYFSITPISALVNAYSSESYPTTFRALALNLFNNAGAFVSIFTPYIGGYSTELFVERPWLFSLVHIQYTIYSYFLSLGMRLYIYKIQET